MKNKISPLGGALDLVALLSLSAIPFSFIFGLPWLDIGLWPQTEGPMSAIHILVAIISFSAGLQLGLGGPRYIASAKSPLVVALFLFAIFSAALVPFSDYPMRSLHGTMKHGVGVLWHIELAICVYATQALWHRIVFRSFISLIAILSTGVIFGLYLVPQNPFGVPLAFTEWVGMLALAVSGIVTLANNNTRWKWMYFGVAIIILTIGYYISDNRAVVLAVVAMSLFWCLKYIPGLNYFYLKPLGRSLIVMVMTVAGVTALYFAAPMIEEHALNDRLQDAHLLSDAKIDVLSLQDGKLGTIWSRSHMIRMLVTDIQENPITSLTGNGFGSFATTYEYHSDEAPGRRFAAPVSTASNTYWDVHEKANFHSHNILAETITSIGIGGGVLWLIVLGLLAASSPIGAMVAVGFAVVSTFWFPLNHMIGVIAIIFGAAAFKPLKNDELAKAPVLSGLSPILTILTSAMLLFTGYASAKLAYTERFERGFTPLLTNSNIETCGFIRTKYFPEPEIVIDLYSILQNRIAKATPQSDEVFYRTTNILTINCMLRRYFQNENNMRALVASLEGREALLKLGRFTFPVMSKEIVNWNKDIQLLLKTIPERTEFIPPYLATLVSERPKLVLQAINELLPYLKDDDPVREYVLAIRASSQSDYQAYQKHLQRAVDLGYANIRPLSSDTAKQLGLN